MPLTPGTKLGPYEIRSPLGAGGMGEVYSALDTRLDRQVAVKILAGHLSASPELKQRLEREARSISALNHPSICHLYDIGSQNGVDFLVMEFLEGETLAARLTRGPVPVNEALKIAIAIADALAVAHRQGIIHRDLKPGNIMLTKGGAKLMDFGLAKPLGSPAPSPTSSSAPSFTAAPTMSGPSPLSPLTTAGSIVGTIQYMSPEQIEGREADARSDIFAFGAVLYEMTTGVRPFLGKSQISLASSILEKDPDPVRALQPETPPALEHVISLCLQKNPEERFQTALDVKLELQWIASGGSVAGPVAPPVASAPSLRRERLIWAGALLAVAVLAAAAGTLFHRRTPQRVLRTALNPPPSTTLNLAGDAAGPPVLSPDGSSMAFTATGHDGNALLWIRAWNSTEAHSIPETVGATFPFWSPDSRSVGFFASGKLKIVDLAGGSPQSLADAPLGRGGAWGAGGVIVYSSDAIAPLSRITVAGGESALLIPLDTAHYTSYRWPCILPDGRHFLYLAMNHDASKSANNAIYYASVDGHENRLLLHAQSNGVYAAGYLLYARGSELLAQSFDPSSGTLSGESRIVAKGVMNDATTWHVAASASADGILVYATGGSNDLQLVWVDRTGRQIAVAAEAVPNLGVAALSPQGDRVALEIDAGIADIWALDLARGVRTRLTFGPVANTTPVWSPDGKWIAYVSNRDGHVKLFRKPSDGSGVEEALADTGDQTYADQWTRDGKNILFQTGSGYDSTIWALSLQGERKARLVQKGAMQAQLSPDARWLAYTSVESGGFQVYVVGFEGAQGRWQVSSKSGTDPKWSADGRELYYLDSTFNLWAVPVKSTGDSLQFGTPQTLVTTWSAPNVFYSVSADGKRVLLDKTRLDVGQSLTVVSDFRADLNAK